MAIIYLTTKYLFKKKPSWENYTISAMILFLVLNPGFDMKGNFLALFPVLFFFIGKFIRHKSTPIINPIVFGLLVPYLIFLALDKFLFITWWGAAYMGSKSLLWLAPVVIYGAYKFRKYYLVITYILSYALLSFLFHDISPLYLLGTGSLYFAGAIMLAEPKTSPSKTTEQIGFGLFAGIASILFTFWSAAVPLIMGIATMNAGFFLWKKFKYS